MRPEQRAFENLLAPQFDLGKVSATHFAYAGHSIRDEKPKPDFSDFLQVHVHVPQTRDQKLSPLINDLRASRDFYFCSRANVYDAIANNHHTHVGLGAGTSAVNHGDV